MQNYYKPPQAAVDNEQQVTDGSKLGVIEELRRTGGWVLFVAIITFIGVATLFLSGIIVLIAGAGLAALSPWPDLPLGPMLAAAALILIALGVIYLLAGMYLAKYKSAIDQLVRSKDDYDLATAIEQQRKAWKVWGIIFIISTLLSLAWTLTAILMPDMIANAMDFEGMLTDIPEAPSE